VDRRAALPVGDVEHIGAEKAAKARELIGKLGDGHLLDLLVKYGPQIVKLVEAILALLGPLRLSPRRGECVS
jgi:hypothetical protein